MPHVRSSCPPRGEDPAAEASLCTAATGLPRMRGWPLPGHGVWNTLPAGTGRCPFPCASTRAVNAAEQGAGRAACLGPLISGA